ncbi:ABC transporter ATP-binding protein [uncultured Algibacter sp.]|uniref:ABC transporter ATP-binding protein n=1 Tax=uncultured Algibacter sp. TaxID=298659 RepID=UPI002619B39F|nr:ABC transporter ATP-binding protein [uncultured Algibacter sp.]
MSDVILKATNISKQYRLGLVSSGTLSHDLTRWWYKVRGKEDPFLKIGEANDRSTTGKSDYVWALQDINFEVNQGEVLGIIGKNGAGKSTLLKILSRVTSPTTGEIKTRGRIASLLEVGTGFHPEMTGRENIYLNGAILGMTKKEIQQKENEIIEFSGCQRYVDTPVKRYSSGMRVRLAFAVAAHLEPDILVIDEVLAVGDAEFQKKAVGKMQDISKGEGRTVLFVSHNMAAVKSLCTRAIVLEHGKIAFEGTVDKAVSFYLDKHSQNQDTGKKWDENNEDIPSGENIKLLSAFVISENEYDISCPTYIEFEYVLADAIENFNLSLVLSTSDNVPIFNSISPVINIEKGVHKTRLILPENFLNNSLYSVRILFVRNSKAILDIEDVLLWEAKEVMKRNIDWYGNIIGQIRPQLKWQFD